MGPDWAGGHGFQHADDWTWLQMGCGVCGFHVRWDDVKSDANDRILGYLTRAARWTRKQLAQDIRDELRGRGCPHV